MKGLLYKDLALMGRQAKLMLLYILVFGVVFMGFMGNTSFALSFISLMMFMFSINCFAYDEQASFDKLTAAAPVPKRAVVLARYLSSLIIWIAGTAGIGPGGVGAPGGKAGGAGWRPVKNIFSVIFGLGGGAHKFSPPPPNPHPLLFKDFCAYRIPLYSFSGADCHQKNTSFKEEQR